MMNKKGISIMFAKIAGIIIVAIVVAVVLYFVAVKSGLNYTLKNLPGYTYQDPEDIDLSEFEGLAKVEYVPKVLVYFDFEKKTGWFSSEETEGLYEWEEKYSGESHAPSWELRHPSDVEGLAIEEENKGTFGKGLVEIADKLVILDAENIRVNIQGEVLVFESLSKKSKNEFYSPILQEYAKAVEEGARLNG